MQAPSRVWRMLGGGEVCWPQSSQPVPSLLSMRQDSLKSDALNGSQGCCLRTGRVQEGWHRPVPPTLGREVWEPVSTLEVTRGHTGAICRVGDKDTLGFLQQAEAGEPAGWGLLRGSGEHRVGCSTREGLWQYGNGNDISLQYFRKLVAVKISCRCDWQDVEQNYHLFICLISTE